MTSSRRLFLSYFSRPRFFTQNFQVSWLKWQFLSELYYHSLVLLWRSTKLWFYFDCCIWSLSKVTCKKVEIITLGVCDWRASRAFQISKPNWRSMYFWAFKAHQILGMLCRGPFMSNYSNFIVLCSLAEELMIYELQKSVFQSATVEFSIKFQSNLITSP